MDKFVFLDTLYNKMADSFLENVSDANRIRLRTAYLDYLHSQFDGLYDGSEDEAVKRSFVTMCVSKEKLIHFDMDEPAKEAFLFKDPVYESLEEISFELAKLAADKKTTGHCEPERSKEEYQIEIEKLCEEVSELFRYSAERVSSEALVDLEYIFGNVDSISFRNSVL